MLYSITNNSVTLFLHEGPRTFDRDSKLGQNIVSYIKDNKSNDEIENLVFAFKKEIDKLNNTNITVGENDVVKFKGESVPRQLGLRMKEFAETKCNIQFLMNFWNKLKKNPGNEIVINRLFEFLEINKHPIFPDGDFLAYKRVKGILNQPQSYLDCHTGTFCNSPGKRISISRNQVDPDIDKTCSFGLHIANYEYAKNFYPNGILLEVKVNPYHVVAIPREYNNQKIRTCEYLVLQAIDNERKEAVYSDEWDVSENEYEQLI